MMILVQVVTITRAEYMLSTYKYVGVIFRSEIWRVLTCHQNLRTSIAIEAALIRSTDHQSPISDYSSRSVFDSIESSFGQRTGA